MPRIGQNPTRWLTRLEPAASVTVTMLVHIPEMSGYWEESLEVLELSLHSLRKNTPEPFELILLDNASCARVRSFLVERTESGAIDRLILSRRNLGKVGGWNVLFACAESEIVSYADSDVLFLPGWLEASVRVLEAFPQAAMVTAQPLPGDLSRHCGATLAGARIDPETRFEEGAGFIPEEYLDSHRLGLGETPEEYSERLANRREVRLTRCGAEAFVSASHFQFTSRKKILSSLLPLPTTIPLGDDPVFDTQVDDGGHWRLCTTEYLVHHLGNRLPNLWRELPWANLDGLDDRVSLDHRERRPVSAGRSRRLANRVLIRRLLKWANRHTYEWLYGGSGD